MKVEYINPFVSPTASVFSTMLGLEVTRGDLRLKESFQPEYEVTGIIGLSGEAAGTVVVSLSREVVLGAAEAMPGEKPTEIEADVIDVVGELTNMIAGAAKAQLKEYSTSLGLPTVMVGKRSSIQFPSAVRPIIIRFESTWGSLCIEVGLVEQPQAAVAS